MANIERGEIDLEVNGKTYTLKLSMSAAVATQQRTKRKLGELLNDAEKLDVVAIRELMFLLLQKFHSTEFKEMKQVDDLIDESGGVKTFFLVLRQLAEANTPTVVKVSGGTEPDPLEAQAGTSDDSILRLVESA